MVDDNHNSDGCKNKRKLNNNNQAQQQPPKKQGVAIAYTARSGERKEYAGTLSLCNKCKFHHNGQCTECGNQGHYKSDCPELKNRNHENQAEGTKARRMGSQYILYIQLEECYADKPLAVPLDGLHIDDKLRFVREPVEIMDREVKRLRKSRVPIVKVRWNSRRGLEFTWEREDQF
ncbi:putative reverse transcriptase domain-containing protein [Tanacetum coccineum]